jgi:hypothetical protein
VNFLKLLVQKDNARGFRREKLRLKEREEGLMEEESEDLAQRCTGVKPRAAARTEEAIRREVERASSGGGKEAERSRDGERGGLSLVGERRRSFSLSFCNP